LEQFERQPLVNSNQKHRHNRKSLRGSIDENTTNSFGSLRKKNNVEMKRSITPYELVAFGVAGYSYLSNVFNFTNRMLGTGLFVTIGTVAREDAGPSIVLSMLLAGLTAFMYGLCHLLYSNECSVLVYVIQSLQQEYL
jgi:hypothetical protein